MTLMMLMKIKTMMIQMSCSETVSIAVCNLNKIKDSRNFLAGIFVLIGMNKSNYGIVSLAINW